MRFAIHSFKWSVLLALVGCGGGGEVTPPPVDNTPASVVISPSGSQTIQSGASVLLTASVRAKDGHVVSGGAAWSSSDGSVASVNSGVVAGLKVGSASITATSGAFSATVSVQVTVGPPVQLVIRTQPVGGTIGSTLATQPVVEIRDAAGNLVTGATAPVTAVIASGGGLLNGQATVLAVGGAASFAGLSISGAAGDRVLTFTSPGLVAATSAAVAMTPPPTPAIVLDNGSFVFNLARGAAPVTGTVQVTNGGTLALTGLALSTVHDPGQPTGWLAASLNTTAAPATMTLSVTPGTLASGSYHAVVQVSAAGATNSPQSVSVTLAVLPGSVIAYGTAAEKVKVVDVAGTFSPTIAVTDSANKPLAGVPVTYTSRSSSVATVTAAGAITARAAGDAWIVAATAASTDSIFVIVPRSATAPIIRTTSTTWVGKARDTTFVTVVLDGRGTTIGAASISIGVQMYPQVFTNFLYTIPAGPPVPTVSIYTSDIIRVALGTAAGTSGTLTVLNLKLVGASAGASGWLTLQALDVSGIDGSDLTSQTTSTRFPIVLK